MRSIKQEVEQESCSRFPADCSTLRKKTDALFRNGLMIPVQKIAGVAMYDWTGTEHRDWGGEIVIEFSKELVRKFHGRDRFSLAGFQPRALERLVKELIPRVEQNHLIPVWMTVDQAQSLTDSAGVVRYMDKLKGVPPKFQTVLHIKK